MRVVRLVAETSQVGADVRAAFASWGRADTVLGGVALLGVTPLGCPRPVEAVILAPRGIVVVVGVDLPDPALRLEAPLDAQWRADGWPLVRPDGALNPAAEALAAARAVTEVLQERRTVPIPVSTVVAVGPYVGQVVQSTGDLHKGVRVLYPEPKSMLAAMRELAVAERPCSVEQARGLIGQLVGDRVPMLIGEFAAEGFADTVTEDLASAKTTLLPKITDGMHLLGGSRRVDALGRLRRARAGRAARRRMRRQLRRSQGRRTRWLPIAAFGLLAVLLVTGIVVAVANAGNGTAAPAPSKPAIRPSPPVTVAGTAFDPEGSSESTDCAGHAYGDVQVWLTQHACTDLLRSVYQTRSGGRTAAVALAVVTFPDPATATQFGTEATAPGTGGITDLVASGGGWAGGPKSFNDAAYTVTVRDTSVRLTEVVWDTGTSSPTDPALAKLAATSAGLPGNQ